MRFIGGQAAVDAARADYGETSAQYLSALCAFILCTESHDGTTTVADVEELVRELRADLARRRRR